MTCLQCSKPLTGRLIKYCSLPCRYLGQLIHPKTLTCLRCGADFVRKPTHGRAIYCSNGCKHAAIRKGSFQIARMRAKELAIAYAEAEGRPNPINSMPITGTA